MFVSYCFLTEIHNRLWRPPWAFCIVWEIKYFEGSDTITLNIDSSFSKGKIEVNVRQGNHVLLDCDLNTKLLKVTSKYLLDINGNLTYNNGEYQFDYSIISGNGVQMPSDLASKESLAYDQTDEIIEKLLNL